MPLALKDEGEAVLAVEATEQTEPFQTGVQILLKVQIRGCSQYGSLIWTGKGLCSWVHES